MGPAAPCPLYGAGGGPALSAPDSWPPAPIWHSPVGVPGRAPYLHVRVHACAVSLLCDNKNLVTTCPRSQIVSPVPIPLGWRFRPPSSRCVAGRGVGCLGAAGPCSGWVFLLASGLVVPICGPNLCCPCRDWGLSAITVSPQPPRPIPRAVLFRPEASSHSCTTPSMSPPLPHGVEHCGDTNDTTRPPCPQQLPPPLSPVSPSSPRPWPGLAHGAL